MRLRCSFLIVALMFVSAGKATIAAAQLTSTPMTANPNCMVENAQVTVNFSGMDTSVAAARAKLDGKMAEVKGLAAEEGFTKLVVQSYNYNMSANFNAGYGEPRFQYNGNISFSILPADRALTFMQMLVKKGYQASVNVGGYANGNCARMPER